MSAHVLPGPVAPQDDLAPPVILVLLLLKMVRMMAAVVAVVVVVVAAVIVGVMLLHLMPSSSSSSSSSSVHHRHRDAPGPVVTLAAVFQRNLQHIRTYVRRVISKGVPHPNQQHALNELLNELRRRNFANKHRLRMYCTYSN